MNFIETFTGQRFQPLRPDVNAIFIEDIAHALSNQCRFAGHCRVFYSVAEHSVRVSRLLRDLGETEEIQMWGLLHDASEAYLVDLPTPLKASKDLTAYVEAEKRLMRAICERFALPLPMPGEAAPPAVKHADAVLLATEARDLMRFRTEHWKGLEMPPLPDRIEPWTSQGAEEAFMKLFFELDVR